MVILGIDPGSYTTGFGILEKGERIRLIHYGAISCAREDSLEDRLLHIIREVENLLEKYKPEVLSMEGVFFAKNVKSALMLGHVRGAILVSARKFGLKFVEYSPRSVKQAITGSGSASKEQVAAMVSTLLGMHSLEGPLDASDALALALTHALPPPIMELLPAVKPKKRKKGKDASMRELILKMGGTLPE